MKILANATVTKLREYSQSYGAPETINVAYIKELDKEIQLFNFLGIHQRTMKKGTKLLISFAGTEIIERTFKTRTNKAMKAHKERIDIERLEDEAKFKENQKLSSEQLISWSELLKNNPEKFVKYSVKINQMNNSKMRNYLKMKFAKHCNNENFQNIAVNGGQLRNELLKLVKS